jgi:hypothetical protein
MNTRISNQLDMNRRDNENRRNDFGRNAETIYREQLQGDKRFGGGWAHDWDSNPNNHNGSYRGGPRNIHWSDDRDYSNREGHGYYADDNSGTVYGGGNRGRGDYGRSSSYGRRGYYDRGTYFEDAGRYSPRFHERREYDEYDRDEELNGSRNNTRMNEGRSYEREAFSERDGYYPRQGRNDRERGDRSRDESAREERERNGQSHDRSIRYGREEYDDRFGANYRSDNEHQHWYQGDRNEERHNTDHRSEDRRRREEHRGFTPGDLGGQYGGRNTW